MGVCCSKKKESSITQNEKRVTVFNARFLQQKKFPYNANLFTNNDQTMTEENQRSTELPSQFLIINNCIISNKTTNHIQCQQASSNDINQDTEKQWTLAQIILSKYEYYNDIDPLNENSHAKIVQIEKQKREHHVVLLTTLSYLNLKEIIKIGRINRKLYIVSGDISLLRNFLQGQKGIDVISVGVRPKYEHSGYVYSVVDTNQGSQSSKSVIKIDKLITKSIENAGVDHQGQFDIILDKRCQKVELENKMFRIRKEKEIDTGSIGGDEKMHQNKTILIQDFDEIGNISIENDSEAAFFNDQRKVSFSLKKRPEDTLQQVAVIQTENLKYKKQKTTQQQKYPIKNYGIAQESQDSIDKVGVYGADGYFNKISINQIQQKSRFATNIEFQSQNSCRGSQEGSFSQRTPSFVRRLRESAISKGTLNSNIIQCNNNNRASNNIFQSQESEFHIISGRQSNKHQNDNKQCGQGNIKISVNDYLNIQLGHNSILTVQTPGGTKATIMPMSSKEGRNNKGGHYMSHNIDNYFKSEESSAKAQYSKKINIDDFNKLQ